MADPIVTIPLANPIRFVLTAPASLVNALDPDFQLTADQAHWGIEPLQNFKQPYITSDVVTLQYQSDSDDTHILRVRRVSDDGIETTFNPTLEQALSDRNIYEVVIDFSGVDPGIYYLELEATDTANPTWTAVSEPIDLKTIHPYSLLLRYSNNDPAFNISWGEDLFMELRLPRSCYLREANNTEELEIFDDDSYNSDVLYGTIKRLLKLTCKDLPHWLHERIQLAMIHDYKEINGIRISNDQGAYKYDYPEDYPFADGEIIVSRWGESQINRHDNSTGFTGYRELEDDEGLRALE